MSIKIGSHNNISKSKIINNDNTIKRPNLKNIIITLIITVAAGVITGIILWLLNIV